MDNMTGEEGAGQQERNNSWAFPSKKFLTQEQKIELEIKQYAEELRRAYRSYPNGQVYTARAAGMRNVLLNLGLMTHEENHEIVQKAKKKGKTDRQRMGLSS